MGWDGVGLGVWVGGHAGRPACALPHSVQWQQQRGARQNWQKLSSHGIHEWSPTSLLTMPTASCLRNSEWDPECYAEYERKMHMAALSHYLSLSLSLSLSLTLSLSQVPQWLRNVWCKVPQGRLASCMCVCVCLCVCAVHCVCAACVCVTLPVCGVRDCVRHCV